MVGALALETLAKNVTDSNPMCLFFQTFIRFSWLFLTQKLCMLCLLKINNDKNYYFQKKC